MTGRSRLFSVAVIVGTMVAATVAGSAALADGDSVLSGSSNIRVSLTGYEETPVALSTTGEGSFRMSLNTHDDTITYRLSYSALEGTVTQAHVHFGSVAQTGGISFFLCTNLGNGPAGTQACPAAPATITGTITPADIIGPTGQGITAGQFDEVVAAFRDGRTYVNVHSTLYPGGEIRAQLDRHH